MIGVAAANPARAATARKRNETMMRSARRNMLEVLLRCLTMIKESSSEVLWLT